MTDEEIMFARLFAPIKAKIQDKNRYITELEKENAELKASLEEKIDFYNKQGLKKISEIEELEKEIEQLKAYESHWDEIEEDAKRIAEENAENSNSVLEFSNSVIELTNTKTELENKVTELEKQIEKMKNFYNCSHSSRALCPNEHKCNGCKDWKLAE